MKKLLNYLPFHFLVLLIAGICIEFYAEIWSNSFLWGIIILAMLTISSKRTWLFSILSGLVFLIMGTYVTYQYDDRNDESYYGRYTVEGSSSVLRVRKVLKPNAFSHRYEAEVIQVDSLQTVGKVLVSVKRDSLTAGFKVDDQILIQSNFIDVQPPLNPHQFDYKGYLARQGIHQQVYLDSDEFLKLNPASTFLGWIAEIRNRIQSSLKNEGFGEDEFGVINALLLGQRQVVSKELLNDYSKAGAIHILAISGLHVGIILLILSWLFKPLETFKKGKFVKLVFIVILLWFFALLAGMSASVVRAVTMFSCVAIGQSLRRKNSVIHSLIFSMFILLLCKPMFLFDVGFQLSYLAVYGIVTIQPKLVLLWNPRWKLIHKLWQLTTVSLAAQISVLPLSLFYFHQFPGLFLLSNLVIVPFLGLILIGGVLIIILSVCSLLPEFLVKIYGGIISWMNDFIRFISEQEAFLFSGISFSVLMMISSYLIIVFGFQFLEKRKVKRLVLFIISVLAFQSVLFFEKYRVESKSEFIVFNQRRESVYGIRSGDQIVVGNNSNIKRNLDFYAVGENVELVNRKNRSSFLRFKNQQVLFVDSLGVFNLEGLQSPVVVLQYSPKINLNRLIKEIKPSQIVADASNYKSLVELWKETCVQTKTPFWNTNQNGAYCID